MFDELLLRVLEFHLSSLHTWQDNPWNLCLANIKRSTGLLGNCVLTTRTMTGGWATVIGGEIGTSEAMSAEALKGGAWRACDPGEPYMRGAANLLQDQNSLIWRAKECIRHQNSSWSDPNMSRNRSRYPIRYHPTINIPRPSGQHLVPFKSIDQWKWCLCTECSSFQLHLW